jgi:cytochrome c oxidase subunit 2
MCIAWFGLLVSLSGCVSEPPPAAEDLPWEIVLTGNDFRWEITDPGRDGKLGTDDDLKLAPPLHLPANTPVRILLRSRDYLYTLQAPKDGIQQIAVPDLTFSMEFDPGKPRDTEFRGDQFCNNAHNALSGSLMIQDWRDYRRWQTAASEQQRR